MTPADIKQARQDARLTQTEAASLVGVALRTWQHWEYGDRKMPEAAWRLFGIVTSGANMHQAKRNDDEASVTD